MKIIDSKIGSSKDIMNLDETLLEELEPNDDPILHLYTFEKKSATFGHFLSPSDYIDLKKAEKFDVELAKRPTGGGMIFHFSDLAFSVLIPSEHHGYFTDPLKNYVFINQIVMKAIERFLQQSPNLDLLPEESAPLDPSSKAFCMAKPTKYDIMIEKKKIVGAAQRRKKQGYLHQASISLFMPDFALIEEILLPNTKVLEAMKLNTTALIQEPKESLQEIQQKMKKELITAFSSYS